MEVQSIIAPAPEVIKKDSNIFGVIFSPIHEAGLTTLDIPQLSDFILLDILGEGTSAQFFSAMEKKSGAKCGIKRIDKKILKKYAKKEFDENALFHNEISIHSKFNNPYIIKLYGAFEDNEYYYLILELGDEDLYYKLTDNTQTCTPFSETVALRFIKMALLGLKDIHEKGILHRDLKIENFIYCKDTDSIKICDFGLSAYKDNLKIKRVGTLQYLAPEVNQKFPIFNEKNDIYSLGVVLYLLVHGTYPHLTGYKFYKEISREFRNIFFRMIDANYKYRASIDELLEYPILKKLLL